MRPAILFPLFAPITSLKGIGPRLGPLYKKLCGEHVADLLWHLPAAVIDRSYSPKLKYADRDRVATVTLRIVEHNPPRKPQLPYRIVGVDDDDQQVIINYFNAKGDYLTKLYPTNAKIAVSGLLERYKANWSMSHPDYVVPVERIAEIPRFEPVYPLTQGLSGKMVRKTVEQALARAPELPEWNDPHLMKREGWGGWKESLQQAHTPQPESIESPTIGDTGGVPLPLREGLGEGGIEQKTSCTPHPTSPSRGEEFDRSLPQQIPHIANAKRRLAYDELLADQLGLAVIRRHHREGGGRPLAGDGALQKKLTDTLPFSLTAGQLQAIAEISADMAAPKRMLRLLQGDVGSGKTVVALFAMLQAAEAGVQAALMAPTEILAKQHYAKLSQFLKPVGIEIGLLVGKGRGGERQPVLDGLADGSLKLVVGTHALFQDDVKFADLGLAVVDEQHRFGVNQRLQLSDKGRGVDILVMTATPIPRTLTLTAFGDMDVSRLPDKPAGRQPIDTRLINMERLEEVIEGVKRQIDKGAQAYWVCPLVMESELTDLAAATERAELLASKLGKENIGLVHGRLPTEQK